jgi:hypothetical protein
VLIRGKYARPGVKGDEFRCSGICTDCEQQTRVTADELLQVSKLWGQNAVHEMIAINEYLNSLDPNSKYNAEELISGAPVAMQINKDRRASMEGLVMAAARVRISDGTPRDMKMAARSVFIPFYENWGQHDMIRKEFTEKWRYF